MRHRLLRFLVFLIVGLPAAGWAKSLFECYPKIGQYTFLQWYNLYLLLVVLYRQFFFEPDPEPCEGDDPTVGV